MRFVYLHGCCSHVCPLPWPPPHPCIHHHTQCGPRFELRPYQVKLGTVDQAHAENEWVLRAYTRSTKKAKLAGEEAADEG